MDVNLQFRSEKTIAPMKMTGRGDDDKKSSDNRRDSTIDMFYPEETHISFDNVSSKRKSVGDRTGERL
jgi:hypothetical protein